MSRFEKWFLGGLVFGAGGLSALFGGTELLLIVGSIGAVCSGIVFFLCGKN